MDVKPTIIENQWLTSEWKVDLEKKQYTKQYTVHTYTSYDIAMQAWHEPSYNKRIVANVNILDPITPDNDIYIKFYTYLKEKGFPIHSDGDIRYIYVNEININHTTFIDNDINITIEDKPKQEDYE